MTFYIGPIVLLFQKFLWHALDEVAKRGSSVAHARVYYLWLYNRSTRHRVVKQIKDRTLLMTSKSNVHAGTETV